MPQVRSDAVRRIEHDPDTPRMQVTFTNGRTYTFCRVPVEIYERFLATSSKGSFYNNRIRGRYHC